MTKIIVAKSPSYTSGHWYAFIKHEIEWDLVMLCMKWKTWFYGWWWFGM